jgi:hypothetical protein
MPRPAFELADIFRRSGAAYRASHGMALEQLRVMRAIEVCRTKTLGGHVETCSQCDHTRISYNSCRNRHCPKCQNRDRAEWLESRKAELLPVEYFHVVFTVPEELARLAFYNQEAVYGILFRAASETLLTIARDPQHLGAEIGFFAILHTWGQNLLHHPHVHCVIPGGGLSPDYERWIGCRPGFFLPVRVLSRLFRRLFLDAVEQAFHKGGLQFPGELLPLANHKAFLESLAPLRQREWVVYAKPPFGGPQQVLEYLGRYTHRVAISNQRILAADQDAVTFQWKDYRHRHKQKSCRMTVPADEFIRRFLIHTLPPGFRALALWVWPTGSAKLALCRRLLVTPVQELLPNPAPCLLLLAALTVSSPAGCPKCGTGTLLRRVLPAYRWPALPPPDSS